MDKSEQAIGECPSSPTKLHQWESDVEYAQSKGLSEAPIVCAHCGDSAPGTKQEVTKEELLTALHELYGALPRVRNGSGNYYRLRSVAQATKVLRRAGRLPRTRRRR